MKRLLCYGDSNTWGLVPGTQDRYQQSVRWTGRLQEALRGRGVLLLEEGVCGRTTVFEDPHRENRSGLKSLPDILEADSPPDAAVIMLGTNDCKPCFGADASGIARGMGRCLDALLTKIPPERVLAVSPPPLGPLVWEEGFDPEFDRASVEKSRALYAEYKKEADRRNVRLLDAGAYAQVSETDQEHLTPEGHATLAAAILREFAGSLFPSLV